MLIITTEYMKSFHCAHQLLSYRMLIDFFSPSTLLTHSIPLSFPTFIFSESLGLLLWLIVTDIYNRTSDEP